MSNPQYAIHNPQLSLPPVLCYHRIGGPLELGVTRVGRVVFTRQMTALARDGWRTLSLGEYAGLVTSATPPPPKTVLLTFDDGYAGLADHAYPVLADLGFAATTFLITDFIGQPNTWDVQYTWHRLTHLEWSTIEQWQGRGLEFGSHGATHRRLTWLAGPDLADDLRRSRELLVARLGDAAGRAIAYPFGAYNAAICGAARQAGFELGFAGPAGPAGPGAGCWSLPRTPVYMWDVGKIPFGLRRDLLGDVGGFVAAVANRCSVGTSWMLKLRR